MKKSRKIGYSFDSPQKLGQKLTTPYDIEVIKNENESTHFFEDNLEKARLLAKSKSVPNAAILWDKYLHWVRYEKGVVHSWSVEQTREGQEIMETV